MIVTWNLTQISHILLLFVAQKHKVAAVTTCYQYKTLQQ